MKTVSINKIPLFSSLDEEEIKVLEKVTKEKFFPKGCIIFQQGEAGDVLFIIVSGKVRVILTDESGREIVLSELGVGEFFGEMAILDEDPRSAGVIAKEDTTLLMLNRKDFVQKVKEHPEIAFKLLREMSKRLRGANRMIESLAFLDVVGRITRLLLDIGLKEGKKIEDKWIIFKRPPHQEIADMIGSSRETVSRVMKRLVKEGYITYHGKEIVLALNGKIFF